MIGRRWFSVVAVSLAAAGLALVLLAPQAFTDGRDRSPDRKLTSRLRELGFSGRIESTLATRLGRPLDKRLVSLGRVLWFDTITRPERRQRVRRLPLADGGFRRHAVDRDRHRQQRRRRTKPRRPAQPAARADGDQHGVLPAPDVELALRGALGRPVRQRRRLHVPRTRRGPRSRTCRTCSSRRRSSRRPNATRPQASTSPATTTPSAPRSLRRLNAIPEYRALFGAGLPAGARGRADHVRDVRARRSPSSSSRSRSRTRRSTATPAASWTR